MTAVDLGPLCDKSWLPTRTCAHCLGHTSDPEPLGLAAEWTPPLHVEGSTFPLPPDGIVYVAEAPTICDWCNRTIKAGEWMSRDPDRELNCCVRCGR